jgi:hypothetical protein
MRVLLTLGRIILPVATMTTTTLLLPLVVFVVRTRMMMMMMTMTMMLRPMAQLRGPIIGGANPARRGGYLAGHGGCGEGGRCRPREDAARRSSSLAVVVRRRR